MTWVSDEQSAYGAQPIELYDFVLNGGDVAAYYYTDHDTDLSVLSQTYLKAPIERSNVTIGNPSDMRPLRITLPQDTAFDVVREIAVAHPPRSATVTIRRYHGNIAEVETIWQGPIRRARLRSRVCTIEVPHQITEALKTEISTANYQAACNHQLYGTDCGVNRASHQTNTTVATIDSTDPRIITITSFGGATPSEHVAGEVVRVSDGERRTITAVSGTQLTLMRAFRNLSVSDSIEVYEGCPHTIAACNTQFSNLARNGGWPYIQTIDVFRFGVFGTRF